MTRARIDLRRSPSGRRLLFGALVGSLAPPCSLAFLRAPLVDVLRGTRSGLRGRSAASQAAMALTILPLAWAGPGASAWVALDAVQLVAGQGLLALPLLAALLRERRAGTGRAVGACENADPPGGA